MIDVYNNVINEVFSKYYCFNPSKSKTLLDIQAAPDSVIYEIKFVRKWQIMRSR